jgi:hypothetical protein
VLVKVTGLDFEDATAAEDGIALKVLLGTKEVAFLRQEQHLARIVIMKAKKRDV